MTPERDRGVLGERLLERHMSGFYYMGQPNSDLILLTKAVQLIGEDDSLILEHFRISKPEWRGHVATKDFGFSARLRADNTGCGGVGLVVDYVERREVEPWREVALQAAVAALVDPGLISLLAYDEAPRSEVWVTVVDRLGLGEGKEYFKLFTDLPYIGIERCTRPEYLQMKVKTFQDNFRGKEIPTEYRIITTWRRKDV